MKIKCNDKVKLKGFQKICFPNNIAFECLYLKLDIDTYLKGYVSQALSFFNRKIKVLEGHEKNIFK